MDKRGILTGDSGILGPKRVGLPSRLHPPPPRQSRVSKDGELRDHCRNVDSRGSEYFRPVDRTYGHTSRPRNRWTYVGTEDGVARRDVRLTGKQGAVVVRPSLSVGSAFSSIESFSSSSTFSQTSYSRPSTRRRSSGGPFHGDRRRHGGEKSPHPPQSSSPNS